ncbi:hypothetical protein [Planctomicrobium piriforme]|nr:hypothetical protein [Planctomicrobium piriforme]
MMVVITGVSMISFVLLGAVQDPQDIPAPLFVLFLAAVLGGVFWLAGMSRGKGAEWGFSGALVGAIIGVVGIFYTREAGAVLIDNGNLTSQDLSDLRRQRIIANRFVQMAFQQTFGLGIEQLPAPMQRSYLFGYSAGEDIDVRDVVMGELLRRDADKMGMTVSNEVVTDYIKRITSKSGLMDALQRAGAQLDPQNRAIMSFYLGQLKEKPLTAEAFTKIRTQLRVSENELLNAIRNELKTVQALELLYGRNEIPPETFWEFYRQLNVRQSADVAMIPVSDFIDAEAKPTDSELKDLFNKYRMNPPGITPEGKLEEGRPGFYQPRRIQIGYLEAVFDKIEPLTGDISDEEVQKRYDERYLRQVPEGDKSRLNLDGPALPKPPSGDMPKPSAETPADGTPAPATPTTDNPAEPKADAAKPQPPAAPGTDEKIPPAAPMGKEPSSSSIIELPATQMVAFFQPDAPATPAPAEKPADKPADAPKADAPAVTPPAAEAKPMDKPADAAAPAPAETKPMGEMSAAEKPATEKPATEKPADGTIPPAPSTETPPAPMSDIPPLDDKLKAELREEIRRERTQAEILKRMTAAFEFLGDMSYRVLNDKAEATHLTLEQATKEIEAYAEKNQLVYVVTPFLSYQELSKSEDYPIGSAITRLGQRTTVTDSLFQSQSSELFRVNQAENFRTLSAFAFWKLGDKPAFIPESLDADPSIRAQVVDAWKRLQAEPKAKARAEELAKQVQGSDKPMPEALAEATVTGKEGSLFVTVRSTGDFTWMQKPIVPPTSMQPAGPVTQSIVPGLEDVGADFFPTVFDKMQPGDVKVIPNREKTAFYVVKITSRYPATAEELNKMRDEFLAAGMQQAYGSLAQRLLTQNSVNWAEELFTKHDVVFLERE